MRCPPDSVRTRPSRSPRPDGSSVPTSSSSIRRPASTPRRATAHSASPGPSPHRSRSATPWRNVRLNTDALPADTTAIRIVARRQPGRRPLHRRHTAAVAAVADPAAGGRRPTPVQVDWTSGLVFPCQRPFGHRYGVAEIPDWRIRPGADLAAAVSTWQSASGGGPLGWLEVSQEPETVATYLKGRYRTGLGCARAVPPIRAEQYRARRAHHRHPRP